MRWVRLTESRLDVDREERSLMGYLGGIGCLGKGWAVGWVGKDRKNGSLAQVSPEAYHDYRNI